MNGLIKQWGQAKDNVQVTFAVPFTVVAKVIISRVADSSSDNSSSSNSVQPLSGETGLTIKTGFIPHYGTLENSGSWLAFGF